MDNLIKQELFKAVKSFLNELELTMDYLDAQIIPSIRLYMKQVDEDTEEFKKFVEYTSQHLGCHQSKFSVILFSEQKVRSNYYNFLSSITLFGNILNFRVFENESKNTKKDIIKYLYSIYMSSVFLSQTNTVENEHVDVLKDKLTEFVQNIQKEAESVLIRDEASSKKTRKVKRNTSSSHNAPPLIPENMGEIGNIMDSILGNKDILNIATDISKKMQSQKLDPMTMLSSLMSGNIENSPLQGLVEEIQQKVENKINSGEIDKEQLENQAKSIMNSITSNHNIPGVSDLLGNMMKDMQKDG